jgi:hypothetical protein
MTPVNNKSLVAFLFDQMQKLDNGEITNEQAREQGNLAKQVNSQMRYELERAKVVMELSKHNAIYKDGANLREVESKNFDTID